MSTQIDVELVLSLAKTLKNRKAPEIYNEMIKYGEKNLHSEFAKLFQKVLTDRIVPSNWTEEHYHPDFQKRRQEDAGKLPWSDSP